MDKRIFKKNQEELEQYLQFKRRGTVVRSKKGKGSYKRKSKYKKLSRLYGAGSLTGKALDCGSSRCEFKSRPSPQII